MKTLMYVLLLAAFALAVAGCRARRRPVIVVDAGTSEIPIEVVEAAE